MNPFKKIKLWIIGETLLKTDDVFEIARINVLYNFTFFFILSSIPYLFMVFTLDAFHKAEGIVNSCAFIAVMVIMKKTGNVTLAVYFLLLNLTLQNLLHFIVGNGKIETVGILFFALYVFFGFVLLGRSWGFAMTIFVVALYLTGLYNIEHDFVLFHIPKQYADPDSSQTAGVMTVLPFMLNVYLVSEFVNARQKAEVQIREQKIKLETKNKDITDSINYASRIQRTLITSEKYIDVQLKRMNKH